MSFLAPLFLLGATAIALPIVFHLIRRSSRERIPFSSLMFLLPTPPRVTRRSKLENVFLLALRCLILSLLAFAFARPFFSKPMTPDAAAGTGQRTVVLLDTSASMRRGDLWAEARQKAVAVFRQAAPLDQVACATFDREMRTILDFEEWTRMPLSDRALLGSKRLEAIQPGWGSTGLGPALTRACELFESSHKDEQVPRRIVLITDLQEGSRLDALQGFEWPQGISVSVEPVSVKRPSNAGLQLALDRDDLAKPVAGESIARVRISNASDSRREQFEIGWRGSSGGFVGQTIDVYVPPGQSRVLSVPRPATEPAVDRIVTVGDEADFDNTVYVVAEHAERARIVFLGKDAAGDANQSLYYVRRAFQETRRLAAEVVSRSPELALTSPDLTNATLLVITDALPEEHIRVVKEFLQGGKTVFFALSQLAATPTLGRLLDQESLGADEVSGPSYAMLGQIDFEHPLFAPFADPRYSDFTKIHFWKHRRVALEKAPNNRVIARFDNGDPALVEVSLGKGKLWILTSGWQPEDSQLALSSKFVPLLYAMLEQSGGLHDERSTFTIGDAVSLTAAADIVTIRKPDASEARVARGEKFNGTDQPGIYTVTGALPAAFAVNLAPEESRTAPLPVEDLGRLRVPLERAASVSAQELQKRREHLQAAQLENRQKLWRWLIVTALVVLVLETWLAGRITRRAVAVAQT